MNRDKLKRLKDLIPILLLLWNPIVLWLYFKSMVIAFIIPFIVLLVGIFSIFFNSLRLKVWLFNICAIVSILFHAEVIFSLVYTDCTTPNLYELCGKYYFNKPYLCQKFNDPEFISTYKTNCQGYRIDNLTQPDQSILQCDWLFIGDSFTQGAQVSYSDMFSTIMYRMNPDMVIVNAGISGAGLYDELNYFRNKGAKLKPKVVFLQVGSFNDFLKVQEHKVSFQDYLMEWSSLYREINFQLYNANELPLGRWTEPFFPDKEDNITSNIFYKETCDIKEQDKREFASCICEFKKEVEKNGGKLVLFLIPSKEQTSPKLLKEVLSAYNIKKSEIDLNIPGDLCRDISQEQKIQFIDMTEDFVKSDVFPFFAHDEHMNSTGHLLVANRLNKELKRSGVPEYISSGNYHERYPNVYNDGSLLFQSQDDDYYYIRNLDLNSGYSTELQKGVSELIHPIMSKDRHYLAFTEGDQEHSETDVVVYDFEEQSSKKLNNEGSYGAIPMFSSDGSTVVFPEWNKKDHRAKIKIYHLLTGKSEYFEDGAECWRPIFADNNSKILYIQKSSPESKFVVKEYNIKQKLSRIVLSKPYDIWDIALSPSGRYLAYAGNKDNNWDIFLYDLFTKETRQITKTLGDEWDPSFGLKDEELWFAGVFGFNDGIYKLIIK